MSRQVDFAIILTAYQRFAVLMTQAMGILLSAMMELIVSLVVSQAHVLIMAA
jgi:hypothetical protein